jgi:hypothetical protein
MELVSTETLTHQVFLNGKLQFEGEDYEWDSIEEKPSSVKRAEAGDTIIVVCYQPFGIEQKVYREEEKEEESSDDAPIFNEAVAQMAVEANTLKEADPEDFMMTDDKSSISDDELKSLASMVNNAFDENGNLRAAAVRDPYYPRATPGAVSEGGDVVITAGKGGDGTTGEVRIIADKIVLDADQVVLGRGIEGSPITSTIERKASSSWTS